MTEDEFKNWANKGDDDKKEEKPKQQTLKKMNVTDPQEKINK
jgi:hypothetical protein